MSNSEVNVFLGNIGDIAKAAKSIAKDVEYMKSWVEPVMLRMESIDRRLARIEQNTVSGGGRR